MTNIPTAKQAQVFWLHATGMTTRQISEVIRGTPQSVTSLLTAAKAKACKDGLAYTCTPPVYERKVGSGMLLAMQAVSEAGLQPKLSKFEQLKSLAMEARLEGYLK